MAVSSEYVAAIRQRLRLTTDDFDNEITDLINAARADLALGGVVEEKANDETDPLILKAVETYVKAEFGLDNDDAERYRASYKEQRNGLTLPKSYTFYFSLPLYNAAREAYRLIKTANLIYIHNDADKQNRKELYERAQGYYNSMLDVLDLAYMNVNHEKLPSNVLKEWVKLITDELAQISKIKRSDKAR